MIDPTSSIDPKRTRAGLRTDPEWIELQHAWPRLSPTVRAALEFSAEPRRDETEGGDA